MDIKYTVCHRQLGAPACMDHSRAPVLDALADYHRAGQFPFTPPGHKQGRGTDPRVAAVLGEAVFHSDVLAVSGLDDRTSSRGVLQEAEELMADAVGADATFFSTCGSSLSVKAAMLAVAGPHEHLVAGRDAHKSVVAGLILSGVRPLWVDPAWDSTRRLAHPPTADAYERMLAAHPEAKGALVTSPTPYGTCAALEEITQACHRRDLPLIVDEAWGAHLPFHPELPTWAMDAGADVCVTSVHKMGSGLEQSSVFHHQGDLIDPTVLSARADLLGTTSPSVLIYAALDGWRRQMVEHGRRLFDDALRLTRSLREAIAGIGPLHVNGDEFLGEGLAAERDPLPIVIDIAELGVTGYSAADWLREHHRINLHLSDHRRISAQITHADDQASADRLLEALRDLVAHVDDLRPATHIEIPTPAQLRLEQVHLPRDAFFGRTEQVPVTQAAGRIAAEMLTPYPPGIPAAIPGERLNDSVVEYLRSGVQAGMVVPDAADPKLESVRVMVEDAAAE